MAVPNGLMPFIDQSTMGSAFGSIPGVNRPQDAGQQFASPLMGSGTPGVGGTGPSDMNEQMAAGLGILSNMRYSNTPQIALANIAQGLLKGQEVTTALDRHNIDKQTARVRLAKAIEDARYKREQLSFMNQQLAQKRNTKQEERNARYNYLEQDSTLSPQERQTIAFDDDAWKKYSANFEPKENWSEPYEIDVGFTRALVRKNEDTGEIKSILTGSTKPPGVSGAGQTGPGGMNLGDVLDDNAARRFINDEGFHPPPGSQVGWALSNGFRPALAQEVKQIQSGRRASNNLADLENLLLNETDGVLKDISSDWGGFDRLLGAGEAAYEKWTQSNPNWSVAESKMQQMLVPLIRFFGEVGNIALAERLAAGKMLPVIGPVPDTAEVAKRKLKQLQKEVQRGMRESSYTATIRGSGAPGTGPFDPSSVQVVYPDSADQPGEGDEVVNINDVNE